MSKPWRLPPLQHPFWPTLFYGSLGLSTVLAALPLPAMLSGAAFRWAIALVLSAAIWYWIAVSELNRGMGQWRARPDLAVLALIPQVAAWYSLATIHPAFYLMLPALVLHIAALFSRRNTVLLWLLLALLVVLLILT